MAVFEPLHDIDAEFLEVLASAISVQELPSQLSILALGPSSPPPAMAAVVVPLTGRFLLLLFKSFTSVQELPFHVSVTATADGAPPPAAIAAVYVAPEPPN